MDFKAISSNLLKNGHETAAKMLQLIGLAKNGKKTEALNSVDSFQQLFSQFLTSVRHQPWFNEKVEKECKEIETNSILLTKYIKESQPENLKEQAVQIQTPLEISLYNLIDTIEMIEGIQSKKGFEKSPSLGRDSVPSQTDEFDPNMDMKELWNKYKELQEECFTWKKKYEDTFARHQEMMLLSFNYINTSGDELSEEITDFREEIKIKLDKEFMNIFPDSKIPQFMERLLVEPQLNFLNAMVGEDVDQVLDFNTLAKSLLTVFEYGNKSLRLIKWAIYQEVNRNSSCSSIFREEVLFTSIIKQYMFLIGERYLQTVLGPTIRKIAGTKRSYEIDGESSESTKTIKKLQKRVKEILETISKYLPHMPLQIRMVAWYLQEIVAERFSKEEAKRIFGSFFFLRFICPAIVSPQLIGLPEVTNKEGTKGLLYVTKVLQNLANDSVTAESKLKPLNELVTNINNRKLFLRFIFAIPDENQEGRTIHPEKITEEQKKEAMKFIANYTQNRINQVQNRERLSGTAEILLGVLSAAVQRQKGQTMARLKKQQDSVRNGARRVLHTVSLDNLGDLNNKTSARFKFSTSNGHKRIPSTLMIDTTQAFLSNDEPKLETDKEFESSSEDSKKESLEDEESSLSFISHFEDTQKKHRKQTSLPKSAFPLLMNEE